MGVVYKGAAGAMVTAEHGNMSSRIRVIPQTRSHLLSADTRFMLPVI